jgi:hypothetical protein
MTFDVYHVDKEGNTVPTPLTIHGMGYGARTLPFARKFVQCDKTLSAAEAKKLAKEFHDEFVKYCKHVSGSDYYFASSGSGYYFGSRAVEKGHDAEAYDTTIRWLQVYITAAFLKCGIKFS